MKKTILFLRGVSGSGKTSLADFLSVMNDNCVAVCADDYFIKDGVYTFVQEEIGKAHKWCEKKVREYLSDENSFNTIIIHNTSTSNHDVEYYKDIAEEYSAKFFSMIVENRHGNKDIHNVSQDGLEKQALTLLNNIKVLNGFNYNTNKTKPRDYSKLEVIEFLRQYPVLDDGLQRLEDEFLISSTKLNGKVLLKYSEGSDKNPVIVRECRGLILSEKDLSIISLPFEKFGNYMESYAHNDIDFSTAKIVEKLDGSCFCLYYDQLNRKWSVQTLGQIEAEKQIAGWGEGKLPLTWADLFWNTVELYVKDKVSILKDLDKDFTYMFELCSPYNKVVVNHPVSKLYFTGMRNKKNLLELWPSCSPDLYEIFDKPKVYDYNDVKEIKNICANVLTDQDEGFVVVSDDFKRVKMKSHKYIEIHYSATVQTLNSITGIVFQHEEDEYLSIYPEYKNLVRIIKNEIERLAAELDDIFKSIIEKMEDKNSKKEFAYYFNMLPNSYLKGFLFMIFNKRVKNGKEALLYYTTPEWRKCKVRYFILNSKIKSSIVFNENTNSIR
ncbi:MAG: hypothetical protein ABIP51_20815 [Bacteroidia bacterium]